MRFLTAAFFGPLICRAALLKEDDSQIPLSSYNNLASAKRPNIVFILTDDQDLHLSSLDYLPLIKKHLVERGTFYKKHFCTTALCCPSRVSLWTGKAAHNTNVTDINPPYGGYPKFISQGLNDAYLPVWLQQAGYTTYYTGKLFNAHTVTNYHSPFAAGWNGSDFLLDPHTYSYLNSTYQRNRNPPVSYEGQYTVDVLSKKAYGFLDDAVNGGKPFFLGVAPIAPHSNVELHSPNQDSGNIPNVKFSPPVPASRHGHLFHGVRIPRTLNFNPDTPSGASWVRKLPKQSQDNIDFNDHFFRQRLRSLQSVDELVDGIVARLEAYGILNDTYIIYTTDNGFHIGQHRLQPGKECGYEEDINIPLIIRGPGVPENMVTDVVTTHTDIVPTIIQSIVDAPLPQGVIFDGVPIPLTNSKILEATDTRHEHVNVEFWGLAITEGEDFAGSDRYIFNNTYKALRIISKSWDLYYSVWCNGEHELYDLKSDPGQLHNLLDEEQGGPRGVSIHNFPLHQISARLDSILFVLKSCKGNTCTQPWKALHPAGNVASLQDALSPRFNEFYTQQQKRIQFDRCEMGYILEAEGPQFETDGVAYRDGLRWSHWV